MSNELVSKFVKTHATPTLNAANVLNYNIKLLYEFWGFCINGTNDLKDPGGMLTGSFNNFPTGFESGSTTLLASGSDGITNLGDEKFYCSSFNFLSDSFVGKHVVMWKSGSSSTDDGIYRIVNVFDSGTIKLDLNNGGTSLSPSKICSFTARNNINYRVIDFLSASSLSGYTDNTCLILNFEGAPYVNNNQLVPQVRIRRISSNNYYYGLQASPSGSWNGTTFGLNDYTDESKSNFSYGLTSNTQVGYMTLMGAKDYLINHIKGGWGSAGCGFHIEIPQRLYSRQIDPNPVVMFSLSHAAKNISYHTDLNAGGYVSSAIMHNPRFSTTDYYTCHVRSQWGIIGYYNGISTTYITNMGNSKLNSSFHNVNNEFIFYDGYLISGFHSSTYFSSGLRVKLRRAKFITNITPDNQMYSNGDWIKVYSRVLWPWNNTLLPYNLLLGGY